MPRLLALALLTSALWWQSAQAHMASGQGDVIVDYRGWYNHAIEQSCCGRRECRPTKWRFNPQTRREEILVGKTWRTFDQSKVIGIHPADEGAHVCTAGGSAAADAYIRCVVRPGFGS